MLWSGLTDWTSQSASGSAVRPPIIRSDFIARVAPRKPISGAFPPHYTFSSLQKTKVLFSQRTTKQLQKSKWSTFSMDHNSPLSPALPKGDSLPLGFSELLQHNAATPSLSLDSVPADTVRVQSQPSSRYGTPGPQYHSQGFDPSIAYQPRAGVHVRCYCLLHSGCARATNTRTCSRATSRTCIRTTKAARMVPFPM